jgi:hypothetical protein
MLQTTTGFPMLLLTVDIRALLIHSAGLASVCDAIKAIVEARMFGSVGASGNISVPARDYVAIDFSSSAVECAVGELIHTALSPSRSTTSTTTTTTPSLSVISKYWCDYVGQLERASRALFTHSLHTSTEECIKGVVEHWAAHLTHPILAHNDTKHRRPMNRAAIILAIILSHGDPRHTHLFTLPLQKAISLSLLEEMRDDRKHLFRIAAVELIGRCHVTVEPFVEHRFYERVVRVWLSDLAGQQTGRQPQTGTVTDPWTHCLQSRIKQSLLFILASEPLYLDRIAQDMPPGLVDPGLAMSLFYTLFTGSVTIPGDGAVAVADAVVRCLDPGDVKRRQRLLPTASPLLFQLVSVCPLLAFHSKRQLLAGGRPDGSVLVWDVKTGSRLVSVRVSVAGTDAVCFSGDGDRVIILSRRDQAIYWFTPVQTPFNLVMSSVLGHHNVQVQRKPVDCSGLEDGKRVSISAERDGVVRVLVDGQSVMEVGISY